MIDFVITWVDGNDPDWRAQKNCFQAKKEEDSAETRFRDWENLRYWFRGVEKFAPWVNRVHFITWGHLPEWLDTDAPKLHIVRHEDYMEKKYLPCFNSNAIEIGMHRIEGLSEQFVYFNDDMFLIDKVMPGDFFRKGKPYDMLALQPVVANPGNPVISQIYLNNSLVLSRHFTKRGSVKKQPGSYFKIGYPMLYFGYNLLEQAFPLFTGFYTVHGPSPFLKSTFCEVWEKEAEILEETLGHRFRSPGDVSQYLFREWQKLSGNFTAGNITKDFQYFTIDNDNSKLLRTIQLQKKKMVCLNDARPLKDFPKSREEIIAAFEKILPEKSGFEK